MRRRWAAAAVLLALALLHLVAPQPAGSVEPLPDRGTAASSSVAERAGAPGPWEEDPVLRPAAARSPRSTGTAGPGDDVPAGAPARARSAGQDGTTDRPPGRARAAGADEAVRGVPALQTFRC